MAYTPIDKSNDYFTPYLWTGNGAVSRVFTGVGLQADMMWSKIRGPSGHQHNIVDTVRGVNQRLISPNLANAEDTTCTHGYFDSLDADGFTITGTGGNWNVNASGNDYVGWNWLGGGTAVSNTDGSITSSVSANTTSGFSVVTWTGNSGTVGHGLGVKPSCIIFKSRQTANNWVVIHKGLGTMSGNVLVLNSTGASSGGGAGQAEPTSSVFTITSGLASNDNQVGYVFAEKKGFSKFGSYTGNGSADGTFVYTGFKPAWVMLKNSSATADWVMLDDKRSPVNETAMKRLFPNDSRVEESGVYLDMLSNGFKIRTSGTDNNGSGNILIYMAFAENPFVTSGGTPTTAR